MKYLAIAIVPSLLGLATAASALTLICENPRREYAVIYEPGEREIIINPDSDNVRYPITVDDNGDATHKVTASTPNGGPTAVLHLRPYLKFEYWSDGQLVQTDGCYQPT